MERPKGLDVEQNLRPCPVPASIDVSDSLLTLSSFCKFPDSVNRLKSAAVWHGFNADDPDLRWHTAPSGSQNPNPHAPKSTRSQIHMVPRAIKHPEMCTPNITIATKRLLPQKSSVFRKFIRGYLKSYGPAIIINRRRLNLPLYFPNQTSYSESPDTFDGSFKRP